MSHESEPVEDVHDVRSTAPSGLPMAGSQAIARHIGKLLAQRLLREMLTDRKRREVDR